jgi:hypothetical protein
MPGALLLGAALLFALVSSQRWLLGPMLARSPRYLDMATALVLPALAVAANAVVQRWKPYGSLVLVLVLVGVPANLQAFDEGAVKPQAFEAERNFVLTVAHSDLAQEVRRDVYPNPHQFLSDALTVGFLRDGLEKGRIPDAPDVLPPLISNVTNRLSVSQSSPADGMLTEDFTCAVLREPLTLHPERGDQFGIRGPLQISTGTGEDRTKWTAYNPAFSGDMLTVEVSDLVLHVRAQPPSPTFTWCTPP